VPDQEDNKQGGKKEYQEKDTITKACSSRKEAQMVARGRSLNEHVIRGRGVEGAFIGPVRGRR